MDPLGTNYDPSKAVDDGSCVYECAVLSQPGDAPGDSICYAYSTEAAAWTSDPAAQDAAGTFADYLAAAEHAVVQGARIYEAPPEGSGLPHP